MFKLKGNSTVNKLKLDYEVFMSDIVQNSCNPFIVARDDGSIIFANSAFANLTGYNVKELLALNWLSELTPQEWHETDKLMFYEMNWSQQYVRYEKQLVLKDNSKAPVEILIQPSGYKGNQHSYYYAFISDIKERKLAEQSLQYQLELQRLTGDISTRFLNIGDERLDIHIEINHTLQRIGNFVEADRAYVFLYSADNQEASNTHEWCAPGIDSQKSILQKVPVQSFEWWKQEIARSEYLLIPHVKNIPDLAVPEKGILAKKQIQSLLVVPMYYMGALKGFVGFDAVIKARTWSTNEIALLKMVSEMVINALERKRAEDQSRTGLEIITNVSDGIVLMNHRSEIIWTNPAFVSITGFCSEELLGSSNLLNRLAMKKSLQQEIITKLQVDFCWEGRVTAQRKDGTKIFALLTVTASTNTQGQIRKYFIVFRDISEYIALEKEQHRLREQTATVQRLASLSRMSAGVVHEIAQPLNAIKILVDGILYLQRNNYPFQTSELIDKLREVSAETNRIDDIIRHMRSFASVGESSGLLPCNLNDAVNRPLKLLGRQISAHGIMVRSFLSDELPQILANNNRLEEVVINLLVNAMQALDIVDKIDKEIHCRTYCNKGLAVLEISDNATGIDDNVKDNLFDAFTTTKPGGQGMGLGLSIVQSIISGFKGQVKAINNAQGGATFTVEFPALA